MWRSSTPVLAILLFFFNASLGAKLPNGFPRCKRKDPDLNKCVLQSMPAILQEMAKGLPTLGLPSINPALVTKIVVQQGQGPVAVNLTFTDIEISGLTTVKFFSTDINIEKYSFTLEDIVERLVLEGNYEISGRILLLPVTGKGRCKLSFINMTAAIGPRGKELMKNGKSYFEVTDFITEAHDLDRIEIRFDNLFNGEKTLGDSMNKLLNENWRELWTELKPAFSETFSAFFLRYTKEMFGKVPIDDLFLD